MAKVKLGNVKGSKGDKGDRGSLWRVTDKMTGQSTSDTAFPGANIEDSAVGDMCLNPITCDIYKCTAGGDAANAKWVWVMNNRGPQGPAGPKGDPTTVDAVLSESSANPIQNKAVATKFKDVQDSLGQVSDFPKMFPAMTASTTALYISVPAPPLAKSASVSGSAAISLRSSSDEKVTFTASGASVRGGLCLIEGAISPAAKNANTCYSAWLENGDLMVKWS